MGDPRKARKKYTTPSHPWQKVRIDAERSIKATYGVKNKREIWKMDSLRKKFTSRAKSLIASRNEQAGRQREEIMQRLMRLGLLDSDAKFDDILGMTLEDVMERRLQTRVWKSGFAKTASQARQFITHGHILVAGKKIMMPSYMVSKAEDSQITFLPKSALADPEHPERVQEKKSPAAFSAAEKHDEKHGSGKKHSGQTAKESKTEKPADAKGSQKDSNTKKPQKPAEAKASKAEAKPEEKPEKKEEVKEEKKPEEKK